MRGPAGYLLAASLYLAVLLPSFVMDVGRHPHPRTYLLEFRLASPRQLLADVVLNVAAFVPLGWLLARGLHDVGASVKTRTLLVVGVCAALSLSVETVQFFLLSRYSSLVDVLSNSAGAVAGALVAYRRRGP